jgi:hypothetical protein
MIDFIRDRFSLYLIPPSRLPLYEDYKKEVDRLAASKLQAVARRYIAIKKVATIREHTLDYALFTKAIGFIKGIENKYNENMSKAIGGITPVYLNPELGVVFKLTESSGNEKRVAQAIKVRDICENQFPALYVPKTRVWGKSIVEEMVPVHANYKNQIGLYIENREHFAEAAKDLTRFLCQYCLDDLTQKFSMYGSSKMWARVRYDNLPLYLVRGENNEILQGKIGLIDLEHFQGKWGSIREGVLRRSRVYMCSTVVALFPYHLEEILKVAQGFDPKIGESREELEEARGQSLELFKEVYETHRDFVLEQGITIDNPEKFEDFEPELQASLEQMMRDAIVKDHYFTGSEEDNLGVVCPMGLREEILSYTLASVHELVTSVPNMIRQKLKSNREKMGGRCDSMTDLLAIRTIECRNPHNFSTTVGSLVYYHLFASLKNLKKIAYHPEGKRLNEYPIFC